MRKTTDDDKALDQVRQKYPDMTMGEMRDVKSQAMDRIRKAMVDRGYDWVGDLSDGELTAFL